MKKTLFILAAMYALGNSPSYALINHSNQDSSKQKTTIDQLLSKPDITFNNFPRLANKIGHDESAKEETTCVGDFYLYKEDADEYLIGTTTCKNGPYAILIYSEKNKGSKKFNEFRGGFIDSNCDGLLERTISAADKPLPECMKK